MVNARVRGAIARLPRGRGGITITNSKAGRIDRFELEARDYGNAIYLDAHPLAVAHLREIIPNGQVTRLDPRLGRGYTHLMVIDGALPRETVETLALLSDILVMEPHPPVDVALALDWHSSPPDSEDDTFHLTPMGDSVYRSKKLAHITPPPEIERLQREIATRMARVIRDHPLLRQATALVTSPPRILANHGYAVQLAEHLEKESGLPIVRTTGKTAVRGARKEGADVDLEDEFTVDRLRVEGEPIIIIDDVYKEGETMRGVALACRRARARAIFGLSATRTLSNYW